MNHYDSYGGGRQPRDDGSSVNNSNIRSRERQHDGDPDKRSWKDPSRSPSRRRQERGSSHGSGGHRDLPADYSRNHQHPSPNYHHRHQHHPYGGRDRSSSRDRGSYRPYNSRGREWDRDHASRYDRRDRGGPRYDGDGVGGRNLGYDDTDYHDGDGRNSYRDYSPRRDYRDRDSHGGRPYRSYKDDDFSRRRGGSPSADPGDPSDTILVEGIVPDLEDPDIIFSLNALQLPGLQDIRIRRDRNSGQRIAFVEFSNVQNAARFLESYPDLTVPLQLPQNALLPTCRVHISYGWSRRDDNSQDWICYECQCSNFSTRRECYRCGEPKPRSASVESDNVPILTGEKDACPHQKPYPILVVTGLGSSTSEEVFAKGVMKLYMDENEDTSQQATGASGLKTTAPVGNTKGLGARSGSLRRIFLIRDRKTQSSWKYGFAEFATTEDAGKAVAKFQATPRFTIASNTVSVGYIHTGVFVPAFPPEPQIEPFVFPALHNPSIKLRYWEYRAFANPHVVSTQSLEDENNLSKAEAPPKKDKKRKAEKDAGGVKKKTIAMAPQMQMWTNKSAEIRGESSNDMPLGERRPTAKGEEGPKTLDAPMPEAAVPALPQPEPVWSYADPNRICCLLCKRKFPSMDHVRQHEEGSTMHKDNLKDDAKKEAGKSALAKVGLEPVLVENGPQYRDRAKARREAHNQPAKPSIKRDQQGKGEKKAKPEPPAPAPPKMAKGMAMLSKMGLKAGEGLGAGGVGRTEIINTDLYRPGVGLGAEGAKIGDAAEEGARATKGDYSDFLKKTQDKARERFEQLSKG